MRSDSRPGEKSRWDDSASARLGWLAVLLLATATASSPADAARPPNVVFFLADDLGWCDTTLYGKTSFYETPNIERLAKKGVRFSQAYAACHVCSPTRASIMSGKYPARLHLTDWLSGRRNFSFQKLLNAQIHQRLPLKELTLAEALKKHGYATGHFGKWHLGEDPAGPLQQGFDVQVPRWNKGWPRAGYHAPFRLNGLKDSKGDYLTDRLNEEALAFIDRNKDRPFFLYLSHFSVHDPIQGRADLVEKYRRKLAERKKPQGPAFVLEENPDRPKRLSPAQLAALMERPSHKDYRVLPGQTVKIKQHQDNIQFAAMVEALDESLGRVLDKLEALGLEENTIVVFFSDNGGMSAANFGNPKRVVNPKRLDGAFSTSNLPLRGAKGWLYEGGVRVPMVIKWPGKGKQGAVCDEPVISTDFYPSILEMAGLPAEPAQHVDGTSLVPALKGQALEHEPIYWHFPHYSNHGMQSPGGAIRSGDYKLLEYFENSTVQLFNIQKDPGEQKDLARTEPKKAAELLATLRDWRKKVSARMMPPNKDWKPAK